MTSSLPGQIAVWTLASWALGWLALPLSRRVFAGLPDGGLAAGRIGFVVLSALLIFWGAAAHLLPLALAPAVAGLIALICASGWRDQKTRDWARLNWPSLLISDAVFLASWATFLWIRLRHPELNDLEKPMDAALISAAWKANYLPFAHPWWGGASFTNYYYFGPFMGALMGRALSTPPHIAYNLVQPAFCALFLSSVWSLGAALTGSRAWGLVVLFLVGLSGPLEPLRQWSQKGWSWPFDWWTTSRVIENTINEYPAFTMAIGDAHAHFYALSLAALWLSLAWSLFAPAPEVVLAVKSKKKAKSGSVTAPREVAEREVAPRRVVILIGGLVLGAWLMTNTWDAPIFGLLFCTAIWGSRHRKPLSLDAPRLQPFSRAEDWFGQPPWKAWGTLFGVAIASAALYFWRFKSPVGGAQLELWLPDLFSFALLWGGWITLGALILWLPATAGEGADESAKFRRLLIGAGLLALVVPFLFYIRGAFGDGPFRHQDTVFKFGLQAWILLGIGIGAELGARFVALARVPKLIVTFVLILLAPVLALSAASTIWTRAIAQGTAQNSGVSLDGTRYLPVAEQRAIEWLQTNGRAGEIVMEGVPLGDSGSPGGDYDGNWGRVGAFSGLSSTLGWPQHVWGWDGNYGEVMARGQKVAALYRLPSALDTARGASELGARYTFFGRGELPWRTPTDDEARAAGFAVHEFAGDDGSRALILERIGG